MNNVDPGSTGSVPVAVLGSASLPVVELDVASLRLGEGAAMPTRWGPQYRDTNGDGHEDLILRFDISESGISCDDTSVVLRGLTVGGIPLIGTDYIRTVGCG